MTIINYLKEYLFILSINFIKVYSIICVYYKKIYKLLLNYKTDKQKDEKDKLEIMLINNGLITNNYITYLKNNLYNIDNKINNNITYLDDIDSKINNNIKYDMIIISLNKYNIIYYNKPTTLIYNLSNISFIALELIYNFNEYYIKLKTNMYNYYVVNNIINKVFIYYYMINILKINLENYNELKYKINILDNNFKLTIIDENQSLIILENNYLIK